MTLTTTSKPTSGIGSESCNTMSAGIIPPAGTTFVGFANIARRMVPATPGGMATYLSGDGFSVRVDRFKGTMLLPKGLVLDLSRAAIYRDSRFKGVA